MLRSVNFSIYLIVAPPGVEPGPANRGRAGFKPASYTNLDMEPIVNIKI